MTGWNVSIFAGLFDPAVYPRCLPWWDLVAVLTTPWAYPSKESCPLWSPVRYEPGASRGLEGVVELSAIVLDVDDGGPWEPAFEASERWPFLFHTSWSHSPEVPKWRLIVPLSPSRPAPAHLWGRLWAWANAELVDGRADGKCKDASRAYFLPACPAESTPLFRSHIHAPLGTPFLDWGELELPEDPEERLKRERDARRAQWDRKPVGQRGAISEQWRRCKHSPEVRERIAHYLGAQIVDNTSGRWARSIQCPNCGRPDVYFRIDANPEGFTRARCNHERSCGGHWHLSELYQA